MTSHVELVDGFARSILYETNVIPTYALIIFRNMSLYSMLRSHSRVRDDRPATFVREHFIMRTLNGGLRSFMRRIPFGEGEKFHSEHD